MQTYTIESYIVEVLYPNPVNDYHARLATMRGFRLRNGTWKRCTPFKQEEVTQLYDAPKPNPHGAQGCS